MQTTLAMGQGQFHGLFHRHAQLTLCATFIHSSFRSRHLFFPSSVGIGEGGGGEGVGVQVQGALLLVALFR